MDAAPIREWKRRTRQQNINNELKSVKKLCPFSKHTLTLLGRRHYTIAGYKTFVRRNDFQGDFVHTYKSNGLK